MKISISLSEYSISNAIKQVADYKKWVLEKNNLLLQKLALIGAQEASVRFATAIYDGYNDSSVKVEKQGTGWAIIARGNAVCFIEFGSGVYYNSGEPYPIPRPEGIAGIGEYGLGHGKQQTWGYYGEPGTNGNVVTSKSGKDVVLTHGNPASMPMYLSLKTMEENVKIIAREVFGGG